jgi:hypothetical protein
MPGNFSSTVPRVSVRSTMGGFLEDILALYQISRILQKCHKTYMYGMCRI